MCGLLLHSCVDAKNYLFSTTGILTVDADGIPVDELESAKTTIAAFPYMLAVGLSVSGISLFLPNLSF